MTVRENQATAGKKLRVVDLNKMCPHIMATHVAFSKCVCKCSYIMDTLSRVDTSLVTTLHQSKLRRQKQSGASGGKC